MGTSFYADDLAYIHHAGFTDLTRRLAPEIVRLIQHSGAPASPKLARATRGGPASPKLARVTRERRRVVEFGCGSGVTAKHLVDAGFEVVGIDVSPAMIQLARRNVPEATFKTGTLATARIPPCRAIVATGEVVSYVVDESNAPGLSGVEGLGTFFTRAAAALERGGLLLFDFMESAEGRTYELRSWAGSDWALVSRASAHRAGRFLTRHITTFRKIGSEYRRGEETHTVRIVPRAKIAAALRRAGFAVTMRRSLGGVKLMQSDVLAIAFKQ